MCFGDRDNQTQAGSTQSQAQQTSKLGPLQRIRLNRLQSGKGLIFPNIGQNKTLADFEQNYPGSTTQAGGSGTVSTPEQVSNDLLDREKKRQEDILAGRNAIDAAFARFNDDYYDQYAQDYLSYYYPQIDEQFARAQGKTHAALVDRGLTQSSIGANSFADLLSQRLAQRTQVANDAANQAGQLRANVEQTKSNLYSLNEAAADPAAANARATAEATALVAPPTYSPLGQIFATAIQPVLYGVNAWQNGMQGRYYNAPYTVPTGSGSATVIP